MFRRPLSAAPSRRALLLVGLAAGWLAAAPLAAKPAPWYWWRSTLDGKRICAQVSPGAAWERDSDPYEGPGCAPRRKVIIVPMR